MKKHLTLFNKNEYQIDFFEDKELFRNIHNS